jgi:chaperonin GroES
VEAVGPGKTEDGKTTAMQVSVGDRVIYSKYAGTEVKYGEEEYIIVSQNDIIAIVED